VPVSRTGLLLGSHVGYSSSFTCLLTAKLPVVPSSTVLFLAITQE